MPKIFISYRRADSRQIAGRIYDQIAAAFGKENVFKDIDKIPVGADFRKVIVDEVNQCDVVLVIIGQKWLNIADDTGHRRLDSQDDFVRIEIETALKRSNVTVIPVLVEGAVMPKSTDLPASLQELSFKNAAVIQDDPYFHHDIERLVKAIKTPVLPTAPTASIPYRKGRELPNNPNARKRDFPLWSIAAGIALIGVLVFAVYMLAIRESDGNDKITPTSNAEVNQPTEDVTEVVIAPTETTPPTDKPVPSNMPSITPSFTPSDTPTATETPTATLEPAAQIALEFTQTAEASALFASATAAQWTYTPSRTNTPTDTPTSTPNYTETYEKERENFVATLTATVWTYTPTATFTPSITPTPTNTLTPTPTLTPTLTEREKAILLAESGVTSNAEWTPYSEADAKGVMMMLVPTGCFMMGSEDGENDEKPVHEQCLTEPFWIDQTEVTRANYKVCIDAQACGFVLMSSTPNNQPIKSVTWFEASDYCEWRGGRLPTEKEWEYAARGPDNLVYPWGNDFMADNVVFVSNSGGETADVGSIPNGASWVGAVDMSGNLWEWISTLYSAEYPYSLKWESKTAVYSMRGLRGGSFFSNASSSRSANRNTDAPDNGDITFGFRCARDFE